MPTRETVVPKGFEVQYDEWQIAPAVQAGQLLHCSGQLGIGPDGRLAEDHEAQIQQAFENVAAVLEAAGASFEDVIELSSFHVGLRQDLETFTRVRDRFVGEPYPAQTAVGVAELGLPGAVIEIKATAVLPV